MPRKPKPNLLLEPELNAITANELSKVSNKADSKTEGEERDAERERLRSDRADSHQNRRERKKYAHRIFVLISSWAGALVLILLLQGFGQLEHFRFSISQPVLLAFIGSTTVEVLGLFYIVTHYLFPTSKSGRTPSRIKRGQLRSISRRDR